MTEQIKRIKTYEEKTDRAFALLNRYEEDLEVLEEFRELLKELETYYTGPLWKKDFADDEAGRLPEELKRGVLSEDALADLLDRAKEVREAYLEALK